MGSKLEKAYEVINVEKRPQNYEHQAYTRFPNVVF
jgi:hypothetical protein